MSQKMQFENLKQSIINNVLVPSEGDRYVTVGYQRARESAQVINEMRQVAIYFSEGSIPEGSSAVNGPVMHDIDFTVELTVAPSATLDLSVMNSETSTATEKATALRKMSEAGVIADRDMDELIRIIFQVLMDARNSDMGMEKGQVGKRWVSDIRKGNPSPDGEYSYLTASMKLTCRVEEQITGEDLPVTPVAGAVFDSDLDLDGDDIEKTGVKVTTS